VTRRYADPVRDFVEVRPDRLGERPAQFLWRGRLYVVRDVLAHWVEVGAWWRQRGADGLPVRVDQAGRQVWRVEARPGRAAASGVYDLAYDESARTWTLARTLD
jgi:hypothetical protein